MGRTLPSITQTFLQEQESLARFRRALRREDQRALDGLLASSRRHLAAAAYASHLLPFEVMLLAMLVEEHKEVMQLRDLVRALVDTVREPSLSGPGRDDALEDTQTSAGATTMPGELQHPGDSSLAADAPRFGAE